MKTRHFLAGALLAALAGCDNSGTTSSGSGSGAYLLGFRALTDDDGNTADYILQAGALDSGTLSVSGQGVEQVGWRYMGVFGDQLFSAGYYNDNQLVAYTLKDGGIVETGRFSYENTLDLFGDMDTSTLLAMEVPRVAFQPRVFHVIDMDAVGLTRKVSDSIYVDHADSLVAWPTALVRDGGNLFVPFYQLHARGDFSTPNTDTAFVAVYSWPGLVLQKVIKDTRMGPIGLYGDRHGAVQTESGDIYAFSSAAYSAGFTTREKSSGILRIRSGETDFDDSYFWDIEAATGNKVVWIHPVGGEKALLRLVDASADTTLWGAYGNYVICRLALADLSSKTLAMIDAIPPFRGAYGGNLFLEDGKAWTTVTEKDSAFLWSIDVSTGAAKRGARIDGYEIPVILKPGS